MKILIINTVRFGQNGITSVIMNYFRNMDKNGLKIDFAAINEVDQVYREEIEASGSEIYQILRKSNVVRYLRQLYKLIKTNRYDVIHVHGNSGTMLIETVIAKLGGVKKVILHAHSTNTNYPAVNAILKYPMMLLADVCIACSKASGDWLYGKHPHVVLNNAIDLNKFRFSEDARAKYRGEFGVAEEYLIGHVGHFSEPKNHFFLIDLFYEFHKLQPDAKLLLIGDGPRFAQVKAKVEELKLQDAVILTGRRNDVAEIYSALDLFILPSCWEGLPLVMVEAQANGLPLLVSDVITRDAKCTDTTFYKPLEHGAASWAEELQRVRNRNYDRTVDHHGDIAEKGFDICREAECLRKIYLN